MNNKSSINYICQQCGASYQKWAGKCDSCHSWNTLIEEITNYSPVLAKANKRKGIQPSNLEIQILNNNINTIRRIDSGSTEFNRALGGGLVPGAAILIGGDPGIGKSTLLLQIVTSLCNNGYECLYLSGEESIEQVKLRAKRTNQQSNNTQIATTTSLNEIIKFINSNTKIDILIIDSIQTIYTEALDSAPGTVAQVRTCAFELIRATKNKGIVLILVGHVTKDGTIAGPKVLEHMVDTVLYFEGERGHQFRIIRTVKNRFGAANEIAVFEMGETGLQEVNNPSAIFLPNHKQKVSGSCIFAGLEGSRPILLEMQALVVPSFLATPRRAVVGWDLNRLAMLTAVLNSRLGINLLDKEIYLNVTGGLKIDEPAADLAAIAALISAAKNIFLDHQTIFFGEVGLSGELRPVVNSETRLNEAAKLGFKKAIIPANNKKSSCKIDVISVNHIKELEHIIT